MADALARRGTIHAQLTGHTDYVAAAGRYYHLADLRYQNGVDTYLNALDAQRELYRARTELVSTQLAYYQNLITLYKVMGGRDGAGGIKISALTQRRGARHVLPRWHIAVLRCSHAAL